jgi:hypothetical protein
VASRRRRNATILIAAAVLVSACQTTPPVAGPAPAKSDKPAFVVISQSPKLDVFFRGMKLVAAHTSEQQNEIALDFAAPVDGALFDRLQQTLPQWIDLAYCGYDNAVIHARQSGAFAVRKEEDGFSLHFTPSEEELPLRGTTGEDLHPDGVQKDEAPFVLKK